MIIDKSTTKEQLAEIMNTAIQSLMPANIEYLSLVRDGVLQSFVRPKEGYTTGDGELVMWRTRADIEEGKLYKLWQKTRK